jgi:hypothetical protein
MGKWLDKFTEENFPRKSPRGELTKLTNENHRQEPLPESAKARRFKVTLTSGKVLLHSAPSGLTRREAIELSKDWGKVAKCVPCPPVEIRGAQKSVGDTLIEACEGTSLSPDTFRALLDDDDLADIAAGLIPSRTLQAYAESLAKRLPPPPAKDFLNQAKALESA